MAETPTNVANVGANLTSKTQSVAIGVGFNYPKTDDSGEKKNARQKEAFCYWLVELLLALTVLVLPKVIDVFEGEGTWNDILPGVFGNAAVFFVFVTSLNSALFAVFGQKGNRYILIAVMVGVMFVCGYFFAALNGNLAITEKAAADQIPWFGIGACAITLLIGGVTFLKKR